MWMPCSGSAATPSLHNASPLVQDCVLQDPTSLDQTPQSLRQYCELRHCRKERQSISRSCQSWSETFPFPWWLRSDINHLTPIYQLASSRNGGTVGLSVILCCGWVEYSAHMRGSPCCQAHVQPPSQPPYYTSTGLPKKRGWLLFPSWDILSTWFFYASSAVDPFGGHKHVI